MSVFRNFGTNFAPNEIIGLPSSFCSFDNYVFGDLNGDGKTDATCISNGKVALSSGFQFFEQGSSGAWCTGSMRFFAGDFDGDGASEVVCDNVGSGTDDIQVRKWKTGALEAAQTWRASFCGSSFLGGDFNGDGKTDIMCNASSVSIALAGTAALQADLMAQSNNGLGGQVSVTYDNSTSFANSLNNPPAKYAVRTMTTNDGRGTPSSVSTTSYAYSGGFMDRKQRRFLGFKHAREFKPCLAGESSCPITEHYFKQDSLASAGKPERIEQRDSAGRMLSAQAFEYQATTAEPLKALSTAIWSYAYDGTVAGCAAWPCNFGKRTKVTNDLYDAFGNVTQTTAYGDFDTSGDEVTTASTYVPNTSAYIVDRLARTLTFASVGTAGTKLTETQIQYDLASTWNQAPSQGYPTQINRWLKSATEDRFVSSTTTYDGFGNPEIATDETGRPVTTAWDTTHHIYPRSVTNGAGEQETWVWDFVCGVPSFNKKPNQQGTIHETVFQTDALCRPTTTTFALGGFETRSYQNLGNPTTQHVKVETPSPTPGQGAPTAVAEAHFDGLGRTYKTINKGSSLSDTITAETTFNARGGVTTQKEPFKSGESPKTTSYVYDVWDRLVRTALPDVNERDVSYGLWSQTTTDENGKSATGRRSLSNPLQTLQERPLGGSLVTTTSTYDVQGRLTSMQDHLLHTWTWDFDSLGRNGQKADPDAGTWTFLYDDAGRLTSQTDAKSQTITLGYDLAGRLQTKTAPGETVTTTYSQARTGFFNTGFPTTITTLTNVLKLDYDALGRGVKQNRTLDSVDYVLNRTYDAAGFLRGITYPDGDAVGTTQNPLGYDAFGGLTAVPGILTSVTYDGAGRPLVQTNANGTTTTRTYSSTRGFLTGISTVGGTTIQNLQYTVDPVGMVSQVTSPVANEGWSYGYDDLYRLISSTNLSTPAESQSWAYDAIGRIETNSRIGNYTYPSVGQARPHAPTQAGSNTYTYDNNGNMTAGEGKVPAWNAENRISSVTAGSQTTVNFTYDANGERLKKTTPTSTSLYPVEDYEITNGIVTKYINLKGLGVVAKRVTTGGTTNTFWLHKDRLGSVQAVTDSAGTEVFRKKYRPYGETLAQSGSNTESLGWIGERNDTETGFTYLHARYYNSGVGAFLSPDPLHPNTPGVGLHRYGYGLGNPIGVIDRNGLASCAVADLLQGNSDCNDSCSPQKELLVDAQPIASLAQECPGGSCSQKSIAEIAPLPQVSVAEVALQQMSVAQLGCVDGSCLPKQLAWGGSQPTRSRTRAHLTSDDEPEPIEIEPGPPSGGGGGGWPSPRSLCLGTCFVGVTLCYTACGLYAGPFIPPCLVLCTVTYTMCIQRCPAR